MTEDERRPAEGEAELEQVDVDEDEDGDVEAHGLPQPPSRPMNSL